MANRRKLLIVGESFEFKIMSIVKAAFPDAIVLHDLRLDSAFLGKETQIDVIAITSNGVFVIEAKNWKHWIKGDYEDHEWTGLSSDRKVMTVFNPFHQNFIHVRTLRNAIRLSGHEPGQFHNLVVLPDGTEIKSNCKEVISLAKLPRVMREKQSLYPVDINECKRQIEGVVKRIGK